MFLVVVVCDGVCLDHCVVGDPVVRPRVDHDDWCDCWDHVFFLFGAAVCFCCVC